MKLKTVTSLFLLFLIGMIKFSQAEGQEKLPDDGRFEVGKCLKKFYLENSEPGINTETSIEDFLETFCSPKKPIKVETTYNSFIQENPEHETLEKCIENLNPTMPNRADQLSVRYKNASMNELKKLEETTNETFSSFTRIATGVCYANEVRKFDNLSEEQKKETLECLKTCTVELFKTLEKIIVQELTAYQKYQEQIRSQKTQKDQVNSQTDGLPPSSLDKKNIKPIKDDEKSKKGNAEKFEEDIQRDFEESNQTKNDEEKGGLDNFLTKYVFKDEKIEFKEKADTFPEVCDKSEVKTIKDLSDLGKKWLKDYDKLIETIYKRYNDPPVKKEIIDALEHYFNGAKWRCAMGFDDTPFQKWILDEEAKIDVRSLELRAIMRRK